MNSAGNVRWRTLLPRPLVALEIDPLGRYLIYGHATGEITRLDLFGGKQGRATPSTPARPAAASGQRARRGAPARCGRPTGWFPRSNMEQQSETAVIAVVDDPPTIAVFTSPHRLQLFSTARPEAGTRARPWPASAASFGPRRAGSPPRPTGQILLCDLRRSTIRRLDVSLVQLTHLAIKPDDFGLAPDPGARSDRQADPLEPLGLEARAPLSGGRPGDRPARICGDHHQRRPTPGLRSRRRVDGRLHIRPDRCTALDRGARGITRRRDLVEPGAASPVAARSRPRRPGRSGSVPYPGRGGRCSGSAASPWSPRRTARALTCDGSGAFHAQGARAPIPTTSFASLPDGEPIRISRHGVHLIGATLDGRVQLAVGGRPTSGTARRRHNGHRRPARQVARLVPQRTGRRPGVRGSLDSIGVYRPVVLVDLGSNRGRSGCWARSQLAWWTRRTIRSIFG